MHSTYTNSLAITKSYLDLKPDLLQANNNPIKSIARL